MSMSSKIRATAEAIAALPSVPNRVIIVIRGGCLESVSVSNTNVSVALLDYDNIDRDTLPDFEHAVALEVERKRLTEVEVE